MEMGETKIVDNSKDITAKKLMAFEFGAKEYAQGFFESVGGSAVNVSAGLTKIGFCAFVFSRVSKNEVGKWIIKRIGRLKIKKNYLQQTGGRQSQVSVVISDKKNKDHIILRTGDSVEEFDLEKAFEKFKEKADWVFVASQKKGWQANMKRIIEFAKNKKAKIVFNPSGYQIENDSKELIGFLKEIEIVFINRDEAIELVKKAIGKVKDDENYLLDEIGKFGAKVVVMTDGEKGAFVKTEKGIIKLKSKKVKKSDTVGAGDAFSSGFLASYIENGDVEKSLAWGIVGSASVVSKQGSTEGLLKKKELENQSEKLLSKIEKI